MCVCAYVSMCMHTYNTSRNREFVILHFYTNSAILFLFCGHVGGGEKWQEKTQQKLVEERNRGEKFFSAAAAAAAMVSIVFLN